MSVLVLAAAVLGLLVVTHGVTFLGGILIGFVARRGVDADTADQRAADLVDHGY